MILVKDASLIESYTNPTEKKFSYECHFSHISAQLPNTSSEFRILHTRSKTKATHMRAATERRSGECKRSIAHETVAGRGCCSTLQWIYYFQQNLGNLKHNKYFQKPQSRNLLYLVAGNPRLVLDLKRLIAIGILRMNTIP